jgi:hypothetical protein
VDWHEPSIDPVRRFSKPVSGFISSNDGGLDDRLREVLDPGSDTVSHSLDELVSLLTDGCVRLHELEWRCLEMERAGEMLAVPAGEERGLQGEIEALRERLSLLRARVVGVRRAR